MHLSVHPHAHISFAGGACVLSPFRCCRRAVPVALSTAGPLTLECRGWLLLRSQRTRLLVGMTCRRSPCATRSGTAIATTSPSEVPRPFTPLHRHTSPTRHTSPLLISLCHTPPRSLLRHLAAPCLAMSCVATPSSTSLHAMLRMTS